MKNKEKSQGVSVKTVGWVAIAVIITISTLLFTSLFMLSKEFQDVQKSASNYISWKQTALDVKDASDYLTDQCRYYVYNKHKTFMDNYFEEANVTRRRDKAIEVIKKYLPNTTAEQEIESAVEKSRELMLTEYYAMRLIVASLDIEMDETYPYEIRMTNLKPEHEILSPQEQSLLALDYVIGDDYLITKDFIISKVDSAVRAIDSLMEAKVIKATSDLKKILALQQALIGLNIAVIAVGMISIYFFLIKPLNHAVDALHNQIDMKKEGLKEYRYLASAYNEVREQSNNVKEKLLYQSEHDQLTGLFNRTGYIAIYRNLKLSSVYYALIDVDFFKEVNDIYGHEKGDHVLKHVASSINKIFNKDNEYTFRLGGDEFAVLISEADKTPIEKIVKKCDNLATKINDINSNIPKVTLSIGIAKGEDGDTTDSLFRKADNALYTSKKEGRNTISVYHKQ